MARTLSAGLISHIAGTAHTRATMLRLDLNDGSTLAITDHDQDLDFDLGDGVVTYLSGVGILPSDVALSTGFEADDFEARGPITDDGLTTLVAMLGGRFDNATAKLFQVNWSDLTQGAIKILQGYVAQADVNGGEFKLTIHSEMSKFSQTVGSVTSLYCRYAFGVTPCPAVPVTLACTVTAVTDERQFAFSFTGTTATGFYNRGTVSFTGGALSGTRKVEVFSFTGGTGWGGVVL